MIVDKLLQKNKVANLKNLENAGAMGPIVKSTEQVGSRGIWGQVGRKK